MIKFTQKKTAFYILWKAYKENPEQFVPTWKFVGEIYIEELNHWFFMSYKGPTNGLTIYFDNPKLFERKHVEGRSGAKYYEYKIKTDDIENAIEDPDLLEFYNLLKRYE